MNPRGPEHTAVLTAASPKSTGPWQEHRTAPSAATTTDKHPAAGLLSLDYIKPTAASHDQQHLIAMLPASQATIDKLRRLR